MIDEIMENSLIEFPPVDDALRMEVGEGTCDLGSVELGTRLTEVATPLQMEEEFASVDKVQNEIKFVGCLERVIEAHEERMVEDLHENVPLLHNVAALVPSKDVFLVEDLDGVMFSSAEMFSQHHPAVRTAADHLHEVEVLRLHTEQPDIEETSVWMYLDHMNTQKHQ